MTTRTTNQLREIAETQVSLLKASLARVDQLSRAQIYTTEHRDNRERSLVAAVEQVVPALAAMEAVVDDERAKHRALIHERDQADDRATQAVTLQTDMYKALQLYKQTHDMLPVIGLLCDGSSCNAAIGIVGIKAVATSSMDEPCLAIAHAAGWKTVDGLHLCPVCQKLEDTR